MNNFILANIFGVIAMILSNFLPYFFNNRKQILIIKLIGSVFVMAQMYFFGAYTAIFNFFVSTAVTVLAYYRTRLPKPNSPIWLASFLIINTVLTIWQWQNIGSLFSYLGSCFGIWGRWVMQPKHMRIIFLIAVSFWSVHDVIFWATSSMAADVLAIISISIAIYRFDIRKQKQKVLR